MKIPIVTAMLCTLALSCGPPPPPRYTPLEGADPIRADPGQATVVFIRPSDASERLDFWVIDETGSVLGFCGPKTYFAARVKPGKHLFATGIAPWAGIGDTPGLRGDLRAGKIYYVEVGFGGHVSATSWMAVLLYAVGPKRPQWAKLPGWLGESRQVSPDAEIAARFFEGTDTSTILRSAKEYVDERERSNIDKHTLLDADGVASAVSPASAP
ncbi:MAG: hypothetical protein U0359_32855 [Byssovorax sp.]